ncbi:MAG: hypothetical protein AB1567_04625 [bacterium]
MICIDSDVLSIYHIFKNDQRFEINITFMKMTKEIKRAVTIFNLLELCGIISGASQHDARKIFEEYCMKKDIEILYPRITLSSEEEFWALQNMELMKRIEKGMRLGDAAILWVVETNPCDSFITWNKVHYVGKTKIEVLTPFEYLKSVDDKIDQIKE